MNRVNRFFTILVIPEKTSKVRRFIIPAWTFYGVVIGFVFLASLVFILSVDYWYVMGQIGENKKLAQENRRLKNQVQIYSNRMATVENTMDRIQTFATRLKVITNLEDRSSLLQKATSQIIPDAATNLGQSQENSPESEDPEILQLRMDEAALNSQFSHVSEITLNTEQNLQELYELLIEQRVFLAALPTRQPSFGYFTSGFGVRKSPTGSEVKMHEGLDIANYPGTIIVSPAFGTVSFAGHKPGYGRTVIIDHGFGIQTLFGHSSRILVKEGQEISRGQQIALMGSTGRSTGSHVHYEVHVHGIPVDPLSYILE